MNDQPIDVEAAEPMAVQKAEPAGAVGPALPAEQIKTPVTAAQAKIEAVAALTMAAYERAATLKLTPEESTSLQDDFPDEAFLPGAAGKENLIYIQHAWLRDRFTAVFGMGQWAIVPRSRWAEQFKTQKGVEGSRVYVEAMLVVRGCFVGEAIGEMEYYPSNASQNYGDAVEGAKTAAFRRCAKELGVGLQAWKKEWCDGWWARRKGGKTAPQRPAHSQTTIPPHPAKQNAPTTTQRVPTAAPATSGAASDACKKRFLELLSPLGTVAAEYMRKAGPGSPYLMDNETLSDLPLRHVPATKAEFDAAMSKIQAFVDGAPAEKWNLPQALVGAAPVATTQPVPASTVPNDDEWWRDIVVPVPHKNQKRDDYLKNPDSIGSLFDARHDDEEARKRLFGFVKFYEPKGWTKRDGTQMPPSAADLKFREALDAFADWEEKHGGDSAVPAQPEPEDEIPF